MKIDDQQLLSICLSEIETSTGYTSGELSNERADAMDRYLGEPYGNEVEGRSQIRTREILETVEGILPSLIRIFTETDNVIRFEPHGEEDEDQAAQETDMVSYVYNTQNRGFFNTYSFLKNALLSKTGIFKTWAEVDDEEEREEYNGLDEMQLTQLMNEDGLEREVLEYDIDENGYNVVFKTKKKKVKINVEVIPPEEFGVNGDARSPYAKDAQFVFQRARKSYTELVADGYDAEMLQSLPFNDDIETEERLARRHLTDESDLLSSQTDISMRMFWITECFLHIDRNFDGISELLKVTIAAGAYSGSSGRLLDVEEVDSIPFSTAPPNILTHKFYGLSIADLVNDLQEIQTTLTRQVIDNTYLANNGQTAANTDFVNIEDLMTRRPGGIVRYDGAQPWNAVVGAIPFNQLPPQTSELFERLDERQKRRTGYGDEVAGLDSAALAQVNTGVAALAFDMARMKIELIARILAEVGFKPMFHDIHELLMKHQDKEMTVKLRGEWVPVNPGEWRTRENSEVQVGIGNVSRERRIMGYEAVIQKQQELVQGGAMGVLVQPEMMYEGYKKWTKAWGFEPDLFFQDPRKLPPPPEKQPGPQDMLMQAQAQALMMDGQSKMQRNQIDAKKLEFEAQKAQQDAEYRETEILLKAQIERLKGDAALARSEADVEGKVSSIQAQRDKDDIEAALKQKQMELDMLNATKDRELEAYKIQTDWYSKMLQLHNVNYTPEMQEYADQEKATAAQAAHEEREHDKRLMGELHANLVQMTEKLGEMEAASKRPKPIKRDATGLIIQIGDQPVTRDASGKVQQIG